MRELTFEGYILLENIKRVYGAYINFCLGMKNERSDNKQKADYKTIV